MAKLRFYVDVPQYYGSRWPLFATTAPHSHVAEGYKRVAFDVDFPPDMMRQHDAVAPVTVVGEIKP